MKVGQELSAQGEHDMLPCGDLLIGGDGLPQHRRQRRQKSACPLRLKFVKKGREKPKKRIRIDLFLRREPLNNLRYEFFSLR